MEDNFEDKIRDVFNNPPEFPFDEKAWDKMEKRLTAKPVEASRWKSLLPMALLSLLFLLGGTYFFKYSIASERILLLETQLRLEREQSQNKMVRDTLTERHHIVIYDTTYVYTTKTIQLQDSEYSQKTDRQQINYPNTAASERNNLWGFPFQNRASSLDFSNPNSNSNTPLFFPNAYANNHVFANQLNRYLLMQNPLSITKASEVAPYDPNNKSTTHLSITGIPTPLFANENANNTSTSSLQEADHRKQKKGLGYYMSYAQPTGYTAGIGVGTSRETTIQLPNPSFSINYLAAIKGSIQYGSRWSVVVGAEYFKNNYKAEAEVDGLDEERYTQGFPELPKEAEEDKFHEIYTQFTYLQIPIAFQYRFLPKRRIHPYVGAGIISRRALKSTVKIEYVNGNGIYTVQKNDLLSNAFQMTTGMGYLGLQIDLTKHWQWQIEGRSEFDLGKEGTYDYEKIRFLKFNTGFQYLF